MVPGHHDINGYIIFYASILLYKAQTVIFLYAPFSRFGMSERRLTEEFLVIFEKHTLVPSRIKSIILDGTND